MARGGVRNGSGTGISFKTIVSGTMNGPRRNVQWQRNRNRSHEIKDQSLGIALCFSFQMVFFALCKEIFEFLIGGVPEHVGKISIK